MEAADDARQKGVMEAEAGDDSRGQQVDAEEAMGAEAIGVQKRSEGVEGTGRW